MTEVGLLMNGESRSDLRDHGYHCPAFVLTRHILPEFVPVKQETFSVQEKKRRHSFLSFFIFTLFSGF